jgi:hypothetical protein
VCGGYRWCSQPSPAGWKYSPVRGLSVVFHGYPLAGSIPPHAGVIGICDLTQSYSPACGGYRRKPFIKTSLYSPACGGYRQLNETSLLSIPPSAGVIGWPTQCLAYSPRMRGLSASALGKSVAYSPACGGYRAGFPSVGQLLLYSPRAGVIGSDGNRQWNKVFPRMRGLSALPDPNGVMVFPRMRGYRQKPVMVARSISPHAGVIIGR